MELTLAKFLRIERDFGQDIESLGHLDKVVFAYRYQC